MNEQMIERLKDCVKETAWDGIMESQFEWIDNSHFCDSPENDKLNMVYLLAYNDAIIAYRDALLAKIDSIV